MMSKARAVCNCSDYLNCNYLAGAKFENWTTAQKLPDNECAKRLNAMLESSMGLDPYNLYKSCYVTQENAENSFVEAKISHYLPSDYSAKITPKRDPNHCIAKADNPLEKYLNTAEVRRALHIPDDVPEWKNCRGLPFTYAYTTDLIQDTMAPQFQKMLEAKLSILVYHGDFDSVCHFLQGQQFLRSDKFDLKLIGQRNQWNYADDIYPVAGYWDHFAQNIDFLTVRGAGHFVPADKPREALQMIGNFIAGTRNFTLPVDFDVNRAPAVRATTDKPSSAATKGLSWIVILLGCYISVFAYL